MRDKSKAKSAANNPILAYVSYNIPYRLDPKREGSLRPTKFYKMLYHINRDAAVQGIHVGVPWYWYRYGPMCDMEDLPADTVQWNTLGTGPNYMQEKGAIYHLNRPKEDIAAEQKNIIDALIAKYEHVGLIRLIDMAYEDLNVPFLADVRNLAEKVKDMPELPSINDSFRRGLLDDLNSMVATFPNEGFDDIEGCFARFEPLLRLLIIKDLEGLKQNARLVEDFRSIVATKAGIMYHSDDCPDPKLEKLGGELHVKIKRFRENLTTLERHAYTHLHRSDDKSSELAQAMMKESYRMALGD